MNKYQTPTFDAKRHMKQPSDYSREEMHSLANIAKVALGVIVVAAAIAISSWGALS